MSALKCMKESEPSDLAAVPAGADFEPLMTLYLTDNTSPAEIERARASGVVKAVKSYPAGATTNSALGVTDMARTEETLAAMADTPAVCEHLHLPLQSGSDAVLARLTRVGCDLRQRFGSGGCITVVDPFPTP